jgi:ribose transport system permease protein
MKRILGILCIVVVLYAAVLDAEGGRTPRNHKNLGQRLALYGIITLGVGVLIVSGGIDLSIGSVCVLSSVAFGLMLKNGVPLGAAMLFVLLIAGLIGFLHGILITKLGLQPFIVTLCGLFLWRGAALWLALPDPMAPLRGEPTGGAGNVNLGEQAKDLSSAIDFSSGHFELEFLDGIPGLEWYRMVPWRLLLFFGIAAVMVVFLHYSVYGRYLYATGANEQAARYAGIPTDRYKILAYILCSAMAGIVGILEMLEHKSAAPSQSANLYELYAITGAVLGGCSLRGGEGTVVGMMLGAAVLPLLRNLVILQDFPPDLENFIVGLALLGGTIADELLRRRAARKGTHR